MTWRFDNTQPGLQTVTDGVLTEFDIDLRFDPNVSGATSVVASCTDPDAGLASGNQCQTFTLSTDGISNPAAAFYRSGRRKLRLLEIVPLQVALYIEIRP